MKKGKLMKNKLIKLMLVVMVFTVMISTPVQAAKLNKTSIKIEKGKTYTLKLKGTKKKATWKTKDKKIVKLSNKKKTSVKIKAVKAGKTTITAKAGKKTYKCKVTVVNPEKKTSDSKTDTDNKSEEATENKTTEQKADEQKEQPVATKKKVWIITKWAESVDTPVHVNERSQWECTCGHKTEDFNEAVKHQDNHILNEEPSAWRVNTIWDSVYWVTTEYPEEGYWAEIGINEYPQGLRWRTDSSYPEGGYYCIDKSGN